MSSKPAIPSDLRAAAVMAHSDCGDWLDAMFAENVGKACAEYAGQWVEEYAMAHPDVDVAGYVAAVALYMVAECHRMAPALGVALKVNPAHPMAAVVSLAAEFPDYPAADLPELPSGFAWHFWRNEACPRAMDESRGLSIFCDFVNPELREDPGGLRFSIHRDLPDGDCVHLASHAEWADVLQDIATR